MVELSNWWRRLYLALAERSERCDRQMITFGIFGAIAYPLFAFLNLYFLDANHYENITLRLTAGLLCLVLALKDYWPILIRWFLPIYWYLTLLFGLPFFFIFMLLHNGLSHAWLLNLLTVVFFIILVVDWLSAIILFVMGGFLAWVVYIITTAHPFILSTTSTSYSQFIGAFLVTILLGILFSRNKDISEREKLNTMQSLAASIAHELRTPLSAISNGINGIKKYLPDLINAYKLANKSDLKVNYINPSNLTRLNSTCDMIDDEVDASFIVIDMLLTRINTKAINRHQFKECSIKKCIDIVLNRYPFDIGDERLVQVKSNNDFIFYGDELLTVHILFNLIKNAIYSIKSVRKGWIEIWLSQGTGYNELHFRDTGKGMSTKTRNKIFERFYSEVPHGTGIGLAFCKLAMQSFGGDIVCQSKQGEYTEFVLHFPQVTDKKVLKIKQ